MKQNFLSKFSSALSNNFLPCAYQNPSIFRILVYSEAEAYSESWYISEYEAYSEPYQTSTMEHFAKIVHGYNYICKLQLFLQYYLFKFSTL